MVSESNTQPADRVQPTVIHVFLCKFLTFLPASITNATPSSFQVKIKRPAARILTIFLTDNCLLLLYVRPQLTFSPP